MEWRNVLFSDESRFCIDHVDGRTVVWRRDGVRLSDACVVEKDRFGGPNVMMWGGIAYGTRTQPVFLNFQHGGGGRGLTAQRYIDQVLRPVVVPFMAQRPGFEFQQDNARPHSARVSQDFLQANGVTVMNWPALSPDMAPIEHLWDEIGRRIKRRPQQPRTVTELQNALEAEWYNIPQVFINRLITSMRRRCTAVINANGGHTRY